MQTVTHPEAETVRRKRNRHPEVSTVAFRCPLDLRIELDVRVARERSSVAEVCIAALRHYLLGESNGEVSA